MTDVFQPEGAQTGSLPVLWHFRMSHYNEKARWALDYKGIRHIRRTLVPGLHMLPLLRLSGQKQVPVLEFRGEIIVGSGAIIRAVESTYPEPPLFPSAPADRQRALELAQYFDDELGPALRLAFFHEILGDSALCTALFAQTLSAPARALYRMGFPAVRALMRREMGIDTRAAQDALEKTLVVLSRLDNLVQPSAPLVGNAFSVADLTAAALLSPVAQPAEFPYPMPANARFARFRERLGHARVLDWCRSMYSRYRGRSFEVADQTERT